MTLAGTDPRPRIRPSVTWRARHLLRVTGLLLGTAFVAGKASPASSPATVTPLGDRLDDVTFASSALGREMRFVVIHPAPEVGQVLERPVLFLLHGRGRHRHSLLELPDARAALFGSGLWIILPDGEDGWYLNSPVVPADRYADHLGEIVRLATSHYGLRSDAAGRAIAGWSMGGYGAVRFAQEHRDDFGTVASVIGLLDFPRPETLPPRRNYTVPIGRFGSDPAGWPALNPLEAVERLRGKSILLITADDAFDRVMNENFSDALTAAGIAHDLRYLTGAHTLEVVRAAMPRVLTFVLQSTFVPPSP